MLLMFFLVQSKCCFEPKFGLKFSEEVNAVSHTAPNQGVLESTEHVFEIQSFGTDLCGLYSHKIEQKSVQRILRHFVSRRLQEVKLRRFIIECAKVETFQHSSNLIAKNGTSESVRGTICEK